MKIVAGLGSIDEYERFVKAGADEFFCGYVPFAWAEKYGMINPLNRREVRFYNVQIGSLSELQILKNMADYYGKPVKLTFNSLYYTKEQYPVIAEIISQCMEVGFENFIIADPALILYLRQQNISCGIHLSGEMSEVNRGMLGQMQPFGIRRVIFHRKNSLEDMKSCISFIRNIDRTEKSSDKLNHDYITKQPSDPVMNGTKEYEAFVLNELCQFSGAFCNSLHCDELMHLCRVPYELGDLCRDASQEGADTIDKKACERCPSVVNDIPSNTDDIHFITDDFQETCDVSGKIHFDENGYLTGSTGCGLCALYQMKQIGITHLKLVGRGNYTDFMEKDIRKLRKALEILENASCEEEYQNEMRASLFPGGCSKNCYYIY